MSQPHTPEPSEPEEAAVPAAAPAAKRSFRDRVHLPRRRRTRFLALGAIVIVLAGAAGAAAVCEHRFGHSEEGGRFAAEARDGWQGDHGRPGDALGGRGREFGTDEGNRHGKHVGQGQDQGMEANGTGALAPAPLPALPADQAVAKAEGAVSGGKVDQLNVVGQQGGGTAWQLDVLGPDGVRHLVTVDGTGTVTGNTVADTYSGR